MASARTDNDRASRVAAETTATPPLGSNLSGSAALSDERLAASKGTPRRVFPRIRESWWMKQFALLVTLQAGGLALGLLLHCTAIGGIQFPALGSSGAPLSAGTVPAGTAGVTAFAWIASLQAVVCYSIFGRLYHRMREHAAEVASVVQHRDEEILRMQDAMVVGLSRLAETRDGDSDGHPDRVGELAELLASAAAKRPEFAGQITPDFIRSIRISATLHDIGKVGVRDDVLMKPGRLTPAERRQMELHTHISSQCLSRIEACLGDSSFLAMAQRIALFHHERWDGSGYPASLYGDNIPLEARIAAIADVYDALSSDRVYKKAYPHQVCVRMICEGAGTQFDPRLVDVFLTVVDQFEALVAADDRPLVDESAAENPATAASAAAAHIESDTVNLSGDTVDFSADVMDLCLQQADASAAHEQQRHSAAAAYVAVRD